jgi:ribulose-phosphate 3-epimerase
MIKNKIFPSILTADFAALASDVCRVRNADGLHLDVMDGHFVPNLTFGAPVIKSLRQTSDAFFDVHLMAENPEDYVKPLADAGADSLTVHLEAVRDLTGLIEAVKSSGMRMSLAVNPETPVDALLPHLSSLDMVLVMTVHPGFGGQSFMAECLEKVRQVRQAAPDIDIQVDGGVDDTKIKACQEAGANVFVSGSFVFEPGVDAESRVNRLKGALCQ